MCWSGRRVSTGSADCASGCQDLLPHPLPGSRRQPTISRARLNYQLYNKLADEGVHLDWAVTLLFYTALHLVQAFLIELAADPSQVPRDHADRRYYVSTRLNPIFHDYRLLEDLSREMRYHPDRPHPTLEQVRRYENEPFTRIVTELRSRGVSLTP
jgi:hypothetical protein